MHIYRSHTCGALRKEDVGKSVRLSGWVHRVRDLGGLLFIAFSSLGLTSGLLMSSRGSGTPLPFDATNRLVATGPVYVCLVDGDGKQVIDEPLSNYLARAPRRFIHWQTFFDFGDGEDGQAEGGGHGQPGRQQPGVAGVQPAQRQRGPGQQAGQG